MSILLYKSYKKTGLARVIDTADYWLCCIYETLWGEKIDGIASRAYKEKRRLKWHEKVAYELADLLPPRIFFRNMAMISYYQHYRESQSYETRGTSS